MVLLLMRDNNKSRAGGGFGVMVDVASCGLSSVAMRG